MNDTPPLVTNVRKIRLRRIKAGSLFKLVLLSSSAIFIPMIVFFGVLAFFGAKTVSFSGEHVTGLKGLITALIMAPFFTIFFSLFAWVGAYIGIRVYGYFWPLELEYVPAEERPEPIQPPQTTTGSGAPGRV
ncbi:MAG: hypothetical protein HYV75_01265 [Opitutae bacterium]|nr:hypothetical protein [Opitutae bacterium]